MQKYFNRELSWLKFNHRVLLQSSNVDLPILERLKFIAIYGINLDEFYMIRVAGLKKLYQKGIARVGADKMTPLQQLEAIRKTLRYQKQELERSFFAIAEQLDREGVKILSYLDLEDKDRNQARKYFFENLYPVIVPIVVDIIHPFPHFNNLSFGIILKLKNTQNSQDIRYALIRIPRFFPRFVDLGDGVFVLCESIVGEFAGYVFEGFEVLSWCPFRITRNADFEIEEEEADDFIELLNEGLKARKKGEIVRLQVGRNQDQSLVEFLQTHIGLSYEDVYQYRIPLNLGALWEIVSHRNYPHLRHQYYQPKISEILKNTDLFEMLDHQEVMLFHPYESFDPIVRFIQQASKDPDVVSIKMTLYRVGKDSPIIQALIEAAEHKQVNVVVELKARFDEENNLGWVRALESAGAHVVYGAVGLKVHAKIALILKKTKNQNIKGYVHISSGNYNIQSAKIYTDISLLSSKDELVKDAIKFFHSLSTGLSNQTELQTIMMAPAQIKPQILSLIEGEKNKGSEGQIIMKMNALVDLEIIDALYEASNAGVRIYLIVRGICCLKPCVEGLSENIKVISIVGKYLEHARIYYFKHGGIYFSSADMMSRNLERRVELLIPVQDYNLALRLLRILKLQLSDSDGAYELLESGEYCKVLGDGENSQIECENLKFQTMIKRF